MVKENNEEDDKIKENEKLTGKPGIYIGIILTAIFFAYLLFSGLSQNQDEIGLNNTTMINEMESINKPENPSEEESKEAENIERPIPPPSIRLRSPQNTTYNETPNIDFVVAGNLDTVLLSIDGEKISVPHDSLIASVDRAVVYTEFNETFEDTESFKKWSKPASGYTAIIEEYGGDHSLRVFTYNPSKGWSWVRKEFDVISGIWYTISAEMKAHNMQGLHIAVDGYDKTKGWKRLVNLNHRKNSMDWNEYSASFYVPSNVEKIRINLNAGYSLDGTNPAYAWFDDIRVYPYPAVQMVNNKSVLFIRELSDGYHNLTIFANNTESKSSVVSVGFTISKKEEKAGEIQEQEKIYGMRDTIVRDDIAVTLEGYSPDYTVQSYSGSKIINLSYARVNLTVENRGDREVTLSFIPYNPVLIGYSIYPGKGEIYEYTKVKIKREDGIVIDHPDQIEKDVIFPNTEKEGAVFFYPSIPSNIDKLKLILYLNGEKFEFMWDRSRLA